MLTIYTSTPWPMGESSEEPLRYLDDVIVWTEELGCDGMLIFADNTSFDPWMIAGRVLEKSHGLVPLIAANPVYQHPVSVAKSINSIAAGRGRRVALNLVTGGFSRHLREIGCDLDHGQRYDRLAEFGAIIAELTSAERPMKYLGEYYRLDGLRPSPPPVAGLEPHLFVSGVSEDCIRVQKKLGATRLSYPREPSEYAEGSISADIGFRLGIIAREDANAAWRLAYERFPVDLFGEDVHDLAARSVESHWHRQLSEDALEESAPIGNYWMYPFRAYKTFCPYVVGDYAETMAYLLRYMQLGASTFILDEGSKDDLFHSVQVLRMAWSKFTSNGS
ncbi:LLM class flavin-dependent oxidoreductase [Streptomyces avicenniae]|uniref:LLM class flavin-dependent oxidoreductase n=1 Tax=Streptomyces avicenniae TaxID=500153 RepID=UPI00069A1457|nr:LLM class flavin-dependent oxidoreductase [Streptomyces avicenniae]